MLARLRFDIWCILGSYPYGLNVISALKKDRCVVNRNTEVVIEGFPRSGNTFAYAVFCAMQDHDVCIAHHIHGAAQIFAAQKLDVPVLFLLREPLAACASLMARQPALTALQVLKWYNQFHTCISKEVENIAFICFDDLVRQPAIIVERLNDKFGTNFRRKPYNLELQKVVHAKVREMDAVDTTKHRDKSASIGWPSRRRSAKKEEALRALIAPNLEEYRKVATNWYVKYKRLCE